MATLRLETTYGWCTVDYTVSSTSTSTTLAIGKIEYGGNDGFLLGTGSITVYLDGTTDSDQICLRSYNGPTRTWSGTQTSRTFTRSHSDVSHRIGVTFGLTATADAILYTSHTSRSVTFTVPARPSFAVTYNANGGTGAPSSQTKWHSETLYLSSMQPTRTGDYVFWHWNTKADGTGTSYSPGKAYTANASLTLYAIWNSLVTFNKNTSDSVGSWPATQTRYYGQALTISGLTPTRTGYSFQRWNTSADNTGTAYAPGQKLAASTVASNNVPIALYAIWDALIYFNANGGTGAPDTRTKRYNVAHSLPITAPTRNGYEFLGWATSPSATTATYCTGSSHTNNRTIAAGSNETLTLYAVWQSLPKMPTISKLTVVRCDEDGTSQDDGTYAKVTCVWRSDTTSQKYGATNTASVTGTVGSGAIAWDSGAGPAASGTAVAIVSGLSIERQYNVSVTVTDYVGNATTKTAILTRAKFLLDFRAGGEAIGIGVAAPASGLEIGFATQINRVMTHLMSSVWHAANANLRASNIDRDAEVPSEIVQSDARLYFCDMDNEALGAIWPMIRVDGATALRYEARAEDADGNQVINYIDVRVLRDGTPAYGVYSPTEFRNALGAVGGVFQRAQGGTGQSSRISQNVTRQNLSTGGDFIQYENGVVSTLVGSGLNLSSPLAVGDNVIIGTCPYSSPPRAMVYACPTSSRATCGKVMMSCHADGYIYLYNRSEETISTSTNIHFSVSWAL